MFITGPTNLPALSYIIADNAKLFDEHVEFVINTVPISHNLCGNIAYEGLYNSLALPANGDPLAYAAANRQFTADSDNVDLIGNTEPYSVKASL